VNRGEHYCLFGSGETRGPYLITKKSLVRRIKNLHAVAYPMAFAIYHEMKAHINNDLGDANKEHQAFGGSTMIPGLLIHNSNGKIIYALGSDAWNEMKQLLQLKIGDGNGSSQNARDLIEMMKMELDANKKKKN
jgi:hypothetical protein